MSKFEITWALTCLLLLVTLHACNSNQQATPEPPILQGEGDVVSWTSDAPIDIEVEATRHKIFIGSMSASETARIKELNPTAITFQYVEYRYLHSWYLHLWTEHAGENYEMLEAGFLHTDGGGVITAPDAAKPWTVANILPGSPYREWAIERIAGDSAPNDGIMIDHPMPFVEWRAFQGPVECTEAEYKRACLTLIADIKERTGKVVIVNLSTAWWLLDGLDNVNLQRAVAACDGVYLQSGGIWTYGILKEKWVVMGGQTPLVFVGSDR